MEVLAPGGMDRCGRIEEGHRQAGDAVAAVLLRLEDAEWPAGRGTRPGGHVALDPPLPTEQTESSDRTTAANFFHFLKGSIFFIRK